MEGHGGFFRRHLAHVARRLARGICVAEHLHVAAERDRAEFPARLRLIGPTVNLRAEADGENLDAHPIVARDQKMPHLVHEYEHGEDDQERNDVG